jgi:hypothetical protein
MYFAIYGYWNAEDTPSWKPELYITNAIEFSILDQSVEEVGGGRMKLFQRFRAILSCKLNLRNFPFDHQVPHSYQKSLLHLPLAVSRNDCSRSTLAPPRHIQRASSRLTEECHQQQEDRLRGLRCGVVLDASASA